MGMTCEEEIDREIKKFFKIICWGFFVIGFLFITAIVIQPKRLHSRTVSARYELINFYPSKHFTVDLKDVETGEVYPKVYVGKHCNAKHLKAGTIFDLSMNYYYMSNDPSKKESVCYFVNLYDKFCAPSFMLK